MGLFNINKDEAIAAAEKQEKIDDLKPKGVYEVRFVQLHPFVETDKTACVSLELRIEGYFGPQGKTLQTKRDGSAVYKNGRLFYKVWFSAKALWALQDVIKAYTGEIMEIADLVDKVNSFKDVKSLEKWFTTLLDESTQRVWVGRKIEGDHPQNTITFIQ